MKDELQTAATALGLEKFRRHIFLCVDADEPKCCPREQTLAAWDFLKNRGDDKARYSNWKLTWMAFQMGRRESRRLMGDYLLKQQDLELHKVYDDGVVTATVWPTRSHARSDS